MTAQNYHEPEHKRSLAISDDDQRFVDADGGLLCRQPDISLADCSPEDKLAFFGNLITESGTPDHACLKRTLPMRYTCYSLKHAPDLYHLEAFFGVIKFFINGLLAFDQAFEAVIGFKNHIYLLGDDTARDISSRLQKEPGLLDSYGASAFLDILGMAGVIYRFNTAHKFGYPDRGSNQLRLNGWGRKYAVDWRVPSSSKTSPEVDIIAGMIEKHRSEYKALSGLCGADIRPLDVEHIHQINLALPFKIVT